MMNVIGFVAFGECSKKIFSSKLSVIQISYFKSISALLWSEQWLPVGIRRKNKRIDCQLPLDILPWVKYECVSSETECCD